MCHSTSLLSYFIKLDKNNFVKDSHHRMILNVGTLMWGEFFLTKILQNGAQGPNEVHFLCITE